MKNILFKLFASCVLVIALASCSKDLPPGDYDANEIGKIKKVVPGIVISKRPVNLHKQNGDSTNPNSKANNFPDSGYNQTHGMEYVIKLASGNIISVVQAEDLRLKNKQKILVIYGKHTRVVADNGSDI